jgi:hypothetical protein
MAKGSGGKSAKTTTLKQGTNRSAKFPDKSMGCKGGSVNASPTRSETAASPKTLGPREA